MEQILLLFVVLAVVVLFIVHVSHKEKQTMRKKQIEQLENIIGAQNVPLHGEATFQITSTVKIKDGKINLGSFAHESATKIE